MEANLLKKSSRLKKKIAYPSPSQDPFHKEKASCQNKNIPFKIKGFPCKKEGFLSKKKSFPFKNERTASKANEGVPNKKYFALDNIDPKLCFSLFWAFEKNLLSRWKPLI